MHGSRIKIKHKKTHKPLTGIEVLYYVDVYIMALVFWNVLIKISNKQIFKYWSSICGNSELIFGEILPPWPSLEMTVTVWNFFDLWLRGWKSKKSKRMGSASKKEPAALISVVWSQKGEWLTFTSPPHFAFSSHLHKYSFLFPFPVCL